MDVSIQTQTPTARQNLLRSAILSAIVLATFKAACFTSSAPITFGATSITNSKSIAYLFSLEKFKSITSLSIVGRPLRAEEEVFNFFFTDGSRAGDEDLFLPPQLAACFTTAIKRASVSALMHLISSFGGSLPFSQQRELSSQCLLRYLVRIPKAMYTFFISGEIFGVEKMSSLHKQWRTFNQSKSSSTKS